MAEKLALRALIESGVFSIDRTYTIRLSGENYIGRCNMMYCWDSGDKQMTKKEHLSDSVLGKVSVRVLERYDNGTVLVDVPDNPGDNENHFITVPEERLMERPS